MAKTPLASIVRHLHRLAARPEAQSVSDAHLLQQYIARRDADAFAELTRRHGPLVWRVCRRLLPQTHLAEEAYQAVFLVLSRRAAKIRKPAALSSWLYAVAYRIARQARADLLREQTHPREPVAAAVPDPASEAAWRELERIVVEEVHALPEKYRLPVLLCYWEGMTNGEAALRLSWPAGTLKTRLLKARQLLHARLTRRGVSLSIGALATLLAAGDADARVPPCLSASAVPVVSRSVAALADGAVRGMTALRVKIVLALVLGSVLAAGASVLGSRAPALEQSEQKTVDAGPPKPHEKPSARADRYGDPLPDGAVSRLGTIRLRHGGLTTALQFAPDGRTLLTMGNDGLRIWGVATGKSVLHLANRSDRYLTPGILSADGKRVVTVDLNRKEKLLRLWDVATGRLLLEFGDHACLSACFSPNGKVLATLGVSQPGIPQFRAFADVVSLWDLSEGRQLRSWKAHDDGVYCGVFMADGKTLITGGADKTIRFWDVASGRETRCLRGEPSATGHIALSSDEKLLATIGLRTGIPAGMLLPSGLAWYANNRIVIRKLETGEEVRRFTVPPPKQRGVSGFTAAIFTPDSKRLLSGGVDRFARVWDLATGEEVRRYDLGQHTVWSLTLTPDGKTLAALPGGTAVRLIDTASGKDLLLPGGHRNEVFSTAFTPDSQTVVTAAIGESPIILWDPATGRERHRLGEMRQLVSAILMSDDGRTLYSFLYGENRIAVWDLLSRKQIRHLTLPAALKAAQTACALSPDGRSLAVADPLGAKVYLLSTANGDVIQQLDGNAGSAAGMSRLAFPADGRSLAVIGSDGSVHFWDLAKNTKRLALLATKIIRGDFMPTGRDAVALSPDGRMLAHVQINGSLALSDLARGKLIHTIEAPRGGVSAFAFSPDGRALAWTDLMDRAVHLLEVATGAERQRFVGHQGRVPTLSFSADGRLLVSGSADTTALVWDMTGQLGSDRSSIPAWDACWTNLAQADARRAYQAMCQLMSHPTRAVAELRKRLRAVAVVEKERVSRLINDLDDERFDVRQQAAAQLRHLGDRAEPALRASLQAQLSLEVRKRVEELLEGMEASAASPENLRVLRSVEILEHIGTPDACDVLRTLASGAADARLTREAKASLERLGRRRTVQP